MELPIREETVINTAREALILSEEGKYEEAWKVVEPMNQLLAAYTGKLDPAVRMMWARISIAASGPQAWPLYLEETRNAFLSMTQKYPEADGEPLEND